MSSFYSEDELKNICFKSIGKNVLISRNATIYSPQKMRIGDNVRIDDFSILSGKITIGNYVHISAGVYLYGGNSGIEIENFAGISAKSTIYAESDDFSGEYMVGSMVDMEFRNLIAGKVVLKKYVQLGASTVVLPNVLLNEGSATGVNTLVNKNLESWTIYTGTPAKKMKERKMDILELEKKFLQKERG